MLSPGPSRWDWPAQLLGAMMMSGWAVARGHVWVCSPTTTRVCVDVFCLCYYKGPCKTHIEPCVEPYVEVQGCAELVQPLTGLGTGELVLTFIGELSPELGKASPSPHQGPGRTGSTPHKTGKQTVKTPGDKNLKGREPLPYSAFHVAVVYFIGKMKQKPGNLHL